MLDWPRSLPGRTQKISTPPGFGPRTVEPVASRYAGCDNSTACIIGVMQSNLMFVCPWMFSLIRNWWPKRCKFLFIYLYPISSTCFGQCFRPSWEALDCIYSFWYIPPTLLPAGVMDETELVPSVKDGRGMDPKLVFSATPALVRREWRKPRNHEISIAGFPTKTPPET